MNLRFVFLLGLVLLLHLSCKKDAAITAANGNSNSSLGSFIPFKFNCDTLPPEPIGLGWIDTTADENKNIAFWAYNPANLSEIIYVANTQLWSYNLNTRVKKFLDKGLMMLPQINQNGWVAYDKLDFNIYVIKTNGDSLKKLTSSIGGQSAKWDYSGKNIYYYQNAFGSNPNQVVKVNKNGNKLDSNSTISYCYAFGKTSDNYLFCNGAGIYLRNISNNINTFLTVDSAGFNHITFDKTDENIYWWNYGGLYKLNIATLQKDTMVKCCENFFLRGINISPNTNKLTFSQWYYKVVVKPWKKLRTYIPGELDLNYKVYNQLIVSF